MGWKEDFDLMYVGMRVSLEEGGKTHTGLLSRIEEEIGTVMMEDGSNKTTQLHNLSPVKP